MISIVYLGFHVFLAFAFANSREAVAWLGPDVAPFVFATLPIWPFFAIVEGTIGMEFYGWLRAKVRSQGQNSDKRIGIV